MGSRPGSASRIHVANSSAKICPGKVKHEEKSDRYRDEHDGTSAESSQSKHRAAIQALIDSKRAGSQKVKVKINCSNESIRRSFA